MTVSVKDEYFHLLKEWLDALMSYMLVDPAHPSIDGGILCPACSVIHGRCHDAVYPFLCMADLSNDTKYLEAARKLFQWSGYMVCDDGSLYNDSQSAWNGITVFSAISLYNALHYHGHLLNPEEKNIWEKRLFSMTSWLETNLTQEGKFHINYMAANAAAMTLAGLYFNRPSMLGSAKRLAHFACGCISESLLVFGEGSIKRSATVRGGCAVDIGYNVEETLPSLYTYAKAMGDEAVMETVRKTAKAHLDLMLPDGAWDNSFGSRNFKWTYWGSRTADGCQAMLNALGQEDPVFAEAAYRNLQLYKRCTDGLLFGGPDYQFHGELPCVHHTFCHAKVLAQALDEGITEFSRARIPSDCPEPLKYYPEIETYRLACGDWRMTVCAGDFEYRKGGHASGGAMTLLWHRDYGPVFAAANPEYSLHEPNNQQLTRKKSLQGSLCPRLERKENGTVYSQVYDFSAILRAETLPDQVIVSANGSLRDITHHISAAEDSYSLQYILDKKKLQIKARMTGKAFMDTSLILPVICRSDKKLEISRHRIVMDGRLCVTSLTALTYKGTVFNLSPGFEAANLFVTPDEEGVFEISIAFLP